MWSKSRCFFDKLVNPLLCLLLAYLKAARFNGIFFGLGSSCGHDCWCIDSVCLCMYVCLCAHILSSYFLLVSVWQRDKANGNEFIVSSCRPRLILLPRQIFHYFSSIHYSLFLPLEASGNPQTHFKYSIINKNEPRFSGTIGSDSPMLHILLPGDINWKPPTSCTSSAWRIIVTHSKCTLHEFFDVDLL